MIDDFVEHGETPGLAPTKDGVLEFFRMQRCGYQCSEDVARDPEIAGSYADSDVLVPAAGFGGDHADRVTSLLLGTGERLFDDVGDPRMVRLVQRS